MQNECVLVIQHLTNVRLRCLYKTTDEMIRTAIMSQNLIEFSDHNHDRISEPHVYGTHNGRKQLLTYQISGKSSSGKIPGWRRVNVVEITSIRITPNFSSMAALSRDRRLRQRSLGLLHSASLLRGWTLARNGKTPAYLPPLPDQAERSGQTS